MCFRGALLQCNSAHQESVNAAQLYSVLFENVRSLIGLAKGQCAFSKQPQFRSFAGSQRAWGGGVWRSTFVQRDEQK